MISILDRIVIRKARGPGWVVGDLTPSGHLSRRAYYLSAEDALREAGKRWAALEPSADVIGLVGGIVSLAATMGAMSRISITQGERLVRERLRCGLTQQALAERTRLSVRTIRRVECGECDPLASTVGRIWYALIEEEWER